MIAQYALRAMRTGALASAAALGLAACTTVLLPPNVAPVITPATSVEEAARRLKEAAADRAAIEADYAASEQVCYARFFVNTCLDEAREKRRAALAVVRAVEVDAEYFTRKAAVEQRDREVEIAVKQFEADEARAAAAPPPAPRAPAEPKAPKAPTVSVEERKAAQEARLARRAEQEKADAPKRAANAAAFEQRRIDALERQREVAEKQAEKAAKAAKKAAEKAEKEKAEMDKAAKTAAPAR